MSFSLAISGGIRGRCALLGPRGLDKMHDTREQNVRLTGAADMDDTGVLQFVGEDIDYQLEDVVIERTERAVDEHPGRLLYQDAGKGEAQLLVLTQFPIPTAGLIEHGREAFKPQPVERARKVVRAETLRLQGVCENLSQSSARQIRCSARQIEYLFASRPDDVTCAPGPQARQCPKQLGFTRARAAQNERAFPGLHGHFSFPED